MRKITRLIEALLHRKSAKQPQEIEYISPEEEACEMKELKGFQVFAQIATTEEGEYYFNIHLMTGDAVTYSQARKNLNELGVPSSELDRNGAVMTTLHGPTRVTMMCAYGYRQVGKN